MSARWPSSALNPPSPRRPRSSPVPDPGTTNHVPETDVPTSVRPGRERSRLITEAHGHSLDADENRLALAQSRLQELSHALALEVPGKVSGDTDPNERRPPRVAGRTLSVRTSGR